MITFTGFNRKPIGILAIACGAICVLAGAAWAVHSYWLTSTAFRATGRITQLVERHGERGDAYYPVFTFADQKGVSHTIYSSVGSYPPPNQPGDSVTVLYHAGAEADAQLDDWFTVWGAPILLAALGIVYLPVGIIMCAWPKITGGAKRLAASP
jgi:hypothetical protein